MKTFLMSAIVFLTSLGALAGSSFTNPRGSESAPVTVVMFGDFQCPYTYRAAHILNQLQTEIPGEFNLVFRHFPLDFHPYAFEAAKASECAKQQGKFWQMYDYFFSEDLLSKWNYKTIYEAVDKVELNRPLFDECMDSSETDASVYRDLEEGKLLKVTGTPNMVLVSSKGLMKVDGAYPVEEMKKFIQEMNPQSK